MSLRVPAAKLSPVGLPCRPHLFRHPLSDEEWRAQSELPLSAEEIEHTLSLVRWFRTRYPDPLGRLAYARRAYTRWTLGQH
jgi:hypothetical protein